MSEHPAVFIIDCQKKGNVVRFYLGNDPNYHGDDWDDRSYEEQCGQVYGRYILGYKDIAFPFEYSVLEPSDRSDGKESRYTRDEFKRRVVPCIVAVDNRKYADQFWEVNDFHRALGYEGIEKFYFGDFMEPDIWIKKEV